LTSLAAWHRKIFQKCAGLWLLTPSQKRALLEKNTQDLADQIKRLRAHLCGIWE